MRNLASIRIEKTDEMLGDFFPAIFFIPNKGEQLTKYLYRSCPKCGDYLVVVIPEPPE